MLKFVKHEKKFYNYTACFSYDCIMRKLAFQITDQLYDSHTDDQRLCFRYIYTAILNFVNLKFQASNQLLWPHNPVCVGPGWQLQRQVFSSHGSYHTSAWGSSITIQSFSCVGSDCTSREGCRIPDKLFLFRGFTVSGGHWFSWSSKILKGADSGCFLAWVSSYITNGIPLLGALLGTESLSIYDTTCLHYLFFTFELQKQEDLSSRFPIKSDTKQKISDLKSRGIVLST